MLPSDRRPRRFCMHGSWRPGFRRANTVIQCGSHCPRRLLGMPATAQAGVSRPGLGPAGCRRGIFDLAREQSHETKGRARSKQRSGHFLTDADPACMEVMFILTCPRIGRPEELTVTRGQPHRNRARPADCGRSSEGFQPARRTRGPLAQRCRGGQRLQKVSAMPTLMREYQPLCNSFCAQ